MCNVCVTLTASIEQGKRLAGQIADKAFQVEVNAYIVELEAKLRASRAHCGET